MKTLSQKTNKLSPHGTAVSSRTAELHPDAATGVDMAASPTSTSFALFADDDATNAPPRIEDGDASKAFVTTPSALADRYFFSRLDPEFVPFILLQVAFVVIGGIDVWQGNLKTGPALVHFIYTCGTIGGLVFGVQLVWQVYKRLRSLLNPER